MQLREGTFRYRLREAFSRARGAVIPNDRPMPLFTLLAVLGNGGQLVQGFAVVLSVPCSVERTRWCALGLTNTIVNMVYGILLMWRMRRRIEDGIPLHCGTCRLFFLEPVNIAFMVYVLWECIWMLLAPQMAEVYRDVDACSSHLSVQLGSCTVFIIIGATLLAFTFMTEFCKMPRWRRLADEKWRQKQRGTRFPHPTISTVLNDNSIICVGHGATTSTRLREQEEHLPTSSMGSVLQSADKNAFPEAGNNVEEHIPRSDSYDASHHRAHSCFSAREGEDGYTVRCSDYSLQGVSSVHRSVNFDLSPMGSPPVSGAPRSADVVYAAAPAGAAEGNQNEGDDNGDPIIRPEGVHITVGMSGTSRRRGSSPPAEN